MIFCRLFFLNQFQLMTNFYLEKPSKKLSDGFRPLTAGVSVQKGRSNIKKSLLGGSQRHWVTRLGMVNINLQRVCYTHMNHMKKNLCIHTRTFQFGCLTRFRPLHRVNSSSLWVFAWHPLEGVPPQLPFHPRYVDSQSSCNKLAIPQRGRKIR